MIKIATLGYLASQKQKDAEVLLKHKRNSAAIYLMGYALELALKKKIAMALNFIDGFPETSTDFNGYLSHIAAFNAINAKNVLSHVRQIKNHDLNQLLFYSGIENKVKLDFQFYWHEIQFWSPSDRYKTRRFTSQQVLKFIRSAKVILKVLKEFK